MAATDTITFDEALQQHVGQLGAGQLRGLFWASLTLLGTSAAHFMWVFVALDPITSHAWECSSAADAACQAVWQQEHLSRKAFCALSPQQWRWTRYDSLVAKFNLVCDDAWKVQFTNSLMFMGALVGGVAFGWVCDRCGRKRPLFAATALVAAAMFASLAANSYALMAVLRVVVGFAAAGQSLGVFLLATEPVGPDFRGMASILLLTFYTAGEFLLVGLAYGLPVWHHLMLAGAALNAACLLLYPVVSESGRWLLSRGQTQAAVDSLQRLAAANKSQMPPQKLVSSRGSSSSSSGDAEPMGLAQVVRQPRLAKRLLVLLLMQFSLMSSYYGISMGVGGIPGSIYMTFSVSAAAEVLALLVVGALVDRIGRRNCVALGQLLGGAACLACAMVQGGTTQTTLAAFGKFGCSAAEAVISIYVAELLPTACRSFIMGLCSQASRVGSITAPFLLMAGAQLGLLGGHSQIFIPFLVFGCLALLSGVLILMMPETLGAAMPETMEDLERLMSVFTAQPWRQGPAATAAFLFRTRAAAEALASRASRAASTTFGTAADSLFRTKTAAGALATRASHAASETFSIAADTAAKKLAIIRNLARVRSPTPDAAAFADKDSDRGASVLGQDQVLVVETPFADPHHNVDRSLATQHVARRAG